MNSHPSILMYIRSAVVICSAVFTYVNCSVPVAGGASEETNARVAGIIVDSLGVPSLGTKVIAVPETYRPSIGNPQTSLQQAITDNRGHYWFQHIDNGSYRIQAIDQYNRQKLLSGLFTVETSTKVDVGVDTLRRPGAVVVALPQSMRSGGVIFIEGTLSAVTVDQGDSIILFDSLPAGMLQSMYYQPVSGGADVLLKDSVAVRAGETGTIVYAGWKYSKQISLNTSATGANVHENVTNFPLLVRLDGSTLPVAGWIPFDFSQSGFAGTDLRFTKANGSPLPFEIEQWDTSSKQAVVWVKMDTVYGNNANQSIIMHWGNSSVMSVSDGAFVFGSDAGFRRVYHLQSNVINDAANRGNPGLDSGTTSATGVVGNCRSFSNSCITFDSLDFSDTFTISLWYLPDPSKNGPCPLIANSAGGARLNGFRFFVNSYDSSNTRLHDGSIWFETGADTANLPLISKPGTVPFTAPAAWHYLAVTINRANGTGQLYYDGSAAPDSMNFGVLQNFNCAGPWRLGGFLDPWDKMTGSIDEVEISSSIRDSAWIKLSYENQRIDSKLINIGL